MNTKWASLIRSNNKTQLHSNRMNMTSTGFAGNRSLITSQYTNRKLLASQGIQGKVEGTRFSNFMSPNPKNTSNYNLMDQRSCTPVKHVLPKKAQKIKYTMDSLKLTWNKDTFMKFYDLKSKAEQKDNFFATVTQVKSKIWKPQVREEWTLDMITDLKGKTRGYLINGFNGDGIKQIVQLEIIKKPKPTLDWKTIKVSNFDLMHSKFGQATCTDGLYIYISGGAEACVKNINKDKDSEAPTVVKPSHKLHISRQCTSELVRFNTKKHEISLLPRGDYIVSPRRDHWIAIYGRFIVSFGGINDLGRVLEDLDIYDTEFGYWQPLKVKNPIEGIWYSEWASVFYPDRFDENKDAIEIDSMPSPNWGKVEHFIKEEGIYFFGGRNKESEVSTYNLINIDQ